jgi:deoxyribonuclease IV
MPLGAHVGFKAPNYLVGSVQEALSYGADALMIYTGPPQSTKRIPIDDQLVKQGLALWEEAGCLREHIVIHAAYLINLGNLENSATVDLGKQLLIDELKRCQQLHCKYLVLHPGASINGDQIASRSLIANSINEVLAQVNNEVIICLEGMAGKGSEVAYQFEHLAEIIEQINQSSRIGVCLDTCHLHDAGYDLSNDDWYIEFCKFIDPCRLKVFHINDSKNPMGAHKDRHENLGHGMIELTYLANIVNDQRFVDVIKILETPYVDDQPIYGKEILLLREFKK